MRAFEAPHSMKKEAFLAKMPKARIGYMECILLQIPYMPRKTWLVSVFILSMAIYGARFVQRDMLWVISAMMPFVALTMTTENARSAVHGMEELEMAARFSLRSVMLARLVALGISHLLFLCILVPVSYGRNAYTLLQTGIYLAVPYLATTVPGLAVARKVHGKESVYICMGIAIAVSGFHGMMSGAVKDAYANAYFGWWVALFFLLLGALAAECHKTMRQTEELTWNLS